MLRMTVTFLLSNYIDQLVLSVLISFFLRMHGYVYITLMFIQLLVRWEDSKRCVLPLIADKLYFIVCLIFLLTGTRAYFVSDNVNQSVCC